MFNACCKFEEEQCECSLPSNLRQNHTSEKKKNTPLDLTNSFFHRYDSIVMRYCTTLHGIFYTFHSLTYLLMFFVEK